jgi:hypothetical protein
MGFLHPLSRKLKKSDIVGKTVSSINARAVNMIKIYFTDGTNVELWAECGSGQYSIPVIEVDPNGSKL